MADATRTDDNFDFYAFNGVIPGLEDEPEVLDFADMEVSTVRPAARDPEVDKLQARLAHDVIAATIRHDYHADRGLLPR